MNVRISIFVLLLCPVACQSQQAGWQDKDLKIDHVFGTSRAKAYAQVLKNKRPQPVVVAVIDSGTDTGHIALQPFLWNNPGEIPGNGIDDDHNGYIDDVHGWNFTGISCSRDSMISVLGKKDFYDSLSYVGVPAQWRKEYRLYRALAGDYNRVTTNLQRALANLRIVITVIYELRQATGKTNPVKADFEKIHGSDSLRKTVLSIMTGLLGRYQDWDHVNKEVIERIERNLVFALDHFLDGRDSTGIISQLITKNSDVNYDKIFLFQVPQDLLSVKQSVVVHGTHVAGIVADAYSLNNAITEPSPARIMTLKVASVLFEITNGDIAEAIRYAVDNGARIINLSLGSPLMDDQEKVEEAIRYAMQKNVLVIHAAGNESRNNDNIPFFPNRNFSDGTRADAWIEVGASGPGDDSTLAGRFSNYGKSSVDVFAPGVDILSTVPGSGFRSYSGTSMAAPVVSGLAALIMAYYPHLSAKEVKEIILASVAKVNHPVRVPGSDAQKPFSELCTSGGIVNTCNAIMLAAQYKKKR